MNKNFNSNSVNNQKSNVKSIDAEINNIFQSLKSQVSEARIVVKEILPRLSSCKGIISVYNKSDIKNQKNNPIKAKSIATFSIYPGIYDPTKIGSIAIYGADAVYYLEMLRKRSTLFGYEIKEVRAEMGMRVFVDVKLKA